MIIIHPSSTLKAEAREMRLPEMNLLCFWSIMQGSRKSLEQLALPMHIQEKRKLDE